MKKIAFFKKMFGLIFIFIAVWYLDLNSLFSSCNNSHCVKRVRIWIFSGPCFPAFGLNSERYGLSLRSQSEWGKIQTRKTMNTDTFHAMYDGMIRSSPACLKQFYHEIQRIRTWICKNYPDETLYHWNRFFCLV